MYTERFEMGGGVVELPTSSSVYKESWILKTGHRKAILYQYKFYVYVKGF